MGGNADFVARLSLRQKYSRESTPPANPHMKRLPQGYDAPFLALKPLFWGLWPILSHHAGSEGDLFSEQQIMRGNASFRTSFALASSLEVSAQTPRISIFLTKRQLPTGATHDRVFAPFLVRGEVLCCTSSH